MGWMGFGLGWVDGVDGFWVRMGGWGGWGDG